MISSFVGWLVGWLVGFWLSDTPTAPTASFKNGKTLSTRVLDMILNNLMVGIQ